MTTLPKLAVAAALATLTVASPAFAQSFNKGDGTGNELSFAYGPGGSKPGWTVVAPQSEAVAAAPSVRGRIAGRRGADTRIAAARSGLYDTGPSGLYDYVAVPSASQWGAAANSPALTGGGSIGYNSNLYNY